MTAKAARRVLVVDDEPQVRELLCDWLTVHGYHAVGARSGEEALELIGRRRFDLIVTDVMMPGISGIELCRRIKSDPATAFTPVIILTAVAELDARVAGLAAGADDFFAKPIQLVELEARVKSLSRLKALHDELDMKTRVLRTLFGRFMSEDVAAEIVSDPARHLTPGGDKREVTVLFGDLRGFTALADGLDPKDVVDILNAYLSVIIDAVSEFGGTLDKFRGDGFMAVFGAPIKRHDDPERAVRCALAIQSRIRDVHFPKFPELRLQLGIGISTGTVVAGIIGSERRLDYTVIGSEVNIAARFEASAGPGQVLITGSTWEHVKDVVLARELGELRVKGVSEGIAAYDVLEMIDAVPHPA
jgi:class 3 adenylate cyclase